MLPITVNRAPYRDGNGIGPVETPMQRRQMVFHLIQQIHLAKEHIEARIGLHVLQQRVNLYPP